MLDAMELRYVNMVEEKQIAKNVVVVEFVNMENSNFNVQTVWEVQFVSQSIRLITQDAEH